MTKHIDREDRLRATAQPLSDPLGRQRPRLGRNVGDDRDGTHRKHGGGRRGERERRHDHLIAWADLQRPQRKLDRHRTVASRDDMPPSDALGQSEFELLDTGSCPRDPTLLDGGGDVLLLCVTDVDAGQRDPSLTSAAW
jgi:hypothetical protein